MGRDLVVLVKAVVEHLILEAERGVVGSIGHRDLFRHVVLHAAVPCSTDLPFPRELEVAKGIASHEIAACGGLAVRQSRNLSIREFSDGAILDLPVRARHRVVADPAPAVERLSVKEQAPSGTLLVGSQTVRRYAHLDDSRVWHNRARNSVGGIPDASGPRDVRTLVRCTRGEDTRAGEHNFTVGHHACLVSSRTGSSRGASRCIISHAVTYARPQTTNIGV